MNVEKLDIYKSLFISKSDNNDFKFYEKLSYSTKKNKSPQIK